MKKILLLGGSAQQIVAIETAKRLGLSTVLCDYLPDNPGQFHADRFYPASTTDREAVLQIARDEGVDGVLAYASDPAAPTAAYVAERLGLPTNPAESVEILCNKDRFRDFLREHGFNAPRAHGYDDPKEALHGAKAFRLPVIVKPVDSSGSKGATVVESWAELPEALASAFSFSRSRRVIIEEYVKKTHPYLIGGDLFLRDGEVILWGLLNCLRDEHVNPLVPVGKSCPLELAPEDEAAVKRTLRELVAALGLQNGALNVELVVDRAHRVWPIDIGPRNGGNMIPDLLGEIFGVDVVEMTIRAAMGMPLSCKIGEAKPYYATYNLHSARDGRFDGIFYAPELKAHIEKECLYKQRGDEVSYFDQAAKALGILFLKFDDREQMRDILSHIGELMEVRLLGDA